MQILFSLGRDHKKQDATAICVFASLNVTPNPGSRNGQAGDCSLCLREKGTWVHQSTMRAVISQMKSGCSYPNKRD